MSPPVATEQGQYDGCVQALMLEEGSVQAEPRVPFKYVSGDAMSDEELLRRLCWSWEVYCGMLKCGNWPPCWGRMASDCIQMGG